MEAVGSGAAAVEAATAAGMVGAAMVGAGWAVAMAVEKGAVRAAATGVAMEAAMDMEAGVAMPMDAAGRSHESSGSAAAAA